MRIRICTAFIIIGFLPLIIFTGILTDAYEQSAIDQKVKEIQSNGYILCNLLASSGYITNRESNVIDAEINQFAMLYEGRIIVIDSSFNIIKDTYNIEVGKTIVSEGVIKSFSDQNSIKHDRTNSYIEITIPIHNTNQTEQGITGVMIITFSTKNIETIRQNLDQKALLLIVTVILIISIIAVIYSDILTKPINGLKNSIEGLTEGYMDEQLSISGYTEIAKLSDAFNKSIARMQVLESSRQEFVSNVSHELKTPITSIKVLADSLLMQENVPVELYREFLEDIALEIERENKIITDLLSLVRMDKTASDMNIDNLNINELLEQILKRLRPIAAKRDIELVLESFRPVLADVDEVKISLAISNLIENAIKYNIEGGWVRVSLNADHKFFFIKVSDSGIGIPEESQGHIFERFYRVDKARSRETGGTGLGLSITRNIILMHRGAVKVYSKEDEGTTFTVRIPLNYIA